MEINEEIERYRRWKCEGKLSEMGDGYLQGMEFILDTQRKEILNNGD